MIQLDTGSVRTENIMPPAGHEKNIAVSVLRLDLVHPVISGNKWFKLRFYLEEAKNLQIPRILTWGGPWSNHIVATAAACRMMNFHLSVLVRGERPAKPSSALNQAEALGAELHFLDRESYREKKIPPFIDKNEFYEIPAGGYGERGAEGAATIADLCDFHQYTHILCAAGTGTMAAGLLKRMGSSQQLLVIPVLKGHHSLPGDILSLAGKSTGELLIEASYHFGGYAKSGPGLFAFMNDLYRETAIPTDFVYTGKLFYAAMDLVRKDHFPANSRLLIIHSGGLQGNESLEKGTLIF